MGVPDVGEAMIVKPQASRDELHIRSARISRMMNE
jgi:hypothetical protein